MGPISEVDTESEGAAIHIQVPLLKAQIYANAHPLNYYNDCSVVLRAWKAKAICLSTLSLAPSAVADASQVMRVAGDVKMSQYWKGSKLCFEGMHSARAYLRPHP